MQVDLAIAGFVLSLFLGVGSGIAISYKLFFQPMKQQFEQIVDHQALDIKKLETKVSEHDACFEQIKTDVHWIKQKLEKLNE